MRLSGYLRRPRADRLGSLIDSDAGPPSLTAGPDGGQPEDKVPELLKCNPSFWQVHYGRPTRRVSRRLSQPKMLSQDDWEQSLRVACSFRTRNSLEPNRSVTFFLIVSRFTAPGPHWQLPGSAGPVCQWFAGPPSRAWLSADIGIKCSADACIYSLSCGRRRQLLLFKLTPQVTSSV